MGRRIIQSTVDFNVRKYEKYIDIVPYPQCNLPLKNQPLLYKIVYQQYFHKKKRNQHLLSFGVENIHNYIKRQFKYSSLYNYPPVVGFSLYISNKTTYYHRINAEADKRNQLSFVKSDIKEICRHVKQCFFSSYAKCIFFTKKQNVICVNM